LFHVNASDEKRLTAATDRDWQEQFWPWKRV